MPVQGECGMARAMGYAGIEVAPYTVCEDPQTMTLAQARELRQVAADHGLKISGLHWLLVKPAGPVPYTHPTLPTNREVVIQGVGGPLKIQMRNQL